MVLFITVIFGDNGRHGGDSFTPEYLYEIKK